MPFKKSNEENKNPRPAAPGRNDPCHCGSGKKYKKCCEAKDEAAEHQTLEKKWSEAEKVAAKAAEEKKQSAASDTAQANPTHKPDLKSQTPGQRHNKLATPKFNMPRRTGGG